MTANLKTLSTLALSALAGAMLTGAASAGTLQISPASSLANVGDVLNFQVDGSGFAETVVGGGFNLSFDPTVLQFTGGSIAASWEFLPSVGTVINQSATLSTLTDVSFSTFANSISGNFAVASLSFKAVGEGISALTFAPSATFDFSDALGNQLNPSLLGGSVTVPVPEASTLAMTLAGLLLMMGLRRASYQSAAKQ